MSTIQMPVPDAGIVARKPQIVAALQAVLPADAVISDPAETRAYECDALAAYRCPPLAVVLPRSTAEVAAALKVCHAARVPVVPRGSGTSLSGGALPTADSVVLGVARMTRVLDCDPALPPVSVSIGINVTSSGTVMNTCSKPPRSPMKTTITATAKVTAATVKKAILGFLRI